MFALLRERQAAQSAWVCVIATELYLSKHIHISICVYCSTGAIQLDWFLGNTSSTSNKEYSFVFK